MKSANKNRHNTQKHQPNEDEIRNRAFEISKTKDASRDHALDDWLQAEQELRTDQSQKSY